MIDKKQCYHLEPPAGLMNDPNGLVWFRGRYYVFFQWNRFRKDHSHKEWGLFTSEDLLHWEFQDGAIQPGETYDRSGVHSGSAFVIDGRLCAFYTGSEKADGVRKSSQCLAVSEDGQHFVKQGVILDTPPGFTEHFRDPKVFRTDAGDYCMVLGGQRKTGWGAVALCRSMDGLHWRYDRLLAVADQHEMVECPDLFSLDGRRILLYCLQRRDNASDQVLSAYSYYRLADFDEQTGVLADKDLEHGYIPMDEGFDFFAPQTFNAPDGRRILLAWMSRLEGEQERIFAENDPRIHCLTLPRELSLCDGRLYQRPVREMYGLLGREIAMEQTGAGQYAVKLPGRTFCLSLQSGTGLQNFQISMDSAVLRWKEGRFIFTRQNWTGEKDEERICPLDTLNCVEIWSDTSSLEVFLNNGESVMSARVFPRQSAPAIVLSGVAENTAVSMREIMADQNTK